MNCQKFESLVSDLARGQLMAVKQLGEALAHSEACSHCAARLRDEQMLTHGLYSLAADMERLAAPPAVEAKLLEAFRARKVVVPIAKRPSSASYWLVAVAAMLLIAISVVVFRWSNRAADEPRQAVKQEQPQPKPDVNKKLDEQLAQDDEKPVVDSPVEAPKPKRVRPPRLHRPASAQVANHVSNEIATDFIPLSYMSAASLQDGGQIVRVQLPRSALANFGLPVNMDRYNEQVKADVLFGVDGRAHAIRFVQ
ncbi:MAG TPA: hypothetical protein VKB02_18565 [Pyrinomonadaceae bacterium]|nr:hypothetical protein [Pyrinomonadaceae bacterium]